MRMETAIQATLAENREGFFTTMIVSLDETVIDRAERVNITVPMRDLARIDRYSKAHGLSRSAFLVQAAREIMQRGA